MPAYNNHRNPCRVPKDKRCEALLRDCWLKPTNNRCRCYARYQFAGQKVCVKHAELLALEVLTCIPGQIIELHPDWPSQRQPPRFVGKDEV